MQQHPAAVSHFCTEGETTARAEKQGQFCTRSHRRRNSSPLPRSLRKWGLVQSVFRTGQHCTIRQPTNLARSGRSFTHREFRSDSHMLYHLCTGGGGEGRGGRSEGRFLRHFALTPLPVHVHRAPASVCFERVCGGGGGRVGKDLGRRCCTVMAQNAICPSLPSTGAKPPNCPLPPFRSHNDARCIFSAAAFFSVRGPLLFLRHSIASIRREATTVKVKSVIFLRFLFL